MRTGTVALATPHHEATRIGVEAVEAGAGAVGAALAAAVALTVVYPHQCSLGGDLVALVRDPSGRVRSYLSVGASPRELATDAVPRAGDRIAGRGAHTVTTPGVVAGWAALAEESSAPAGASPVSAGGAIAPPGESSAPAEKPPALVGELPVLVGGVPALRWALLRAAELAAGGVEVASGLGRALAGTWDVIGADPGMRSVFAGPSGAPLATGQLLWQPRLAQTLRELAADPLTFYQGPLAERIAAGLARLGSPLTTVDLAAHRVDTREPLSVRAGGRDWFVAPPPSQGVAFLALRATGSAELLERALVAAAVRDERLADPEFGAVTVEDFVQALAVGAPDLAVERPAGDTVAVTAVDHEGWAVSIVQSVFQAFGSGLCDPETGIVFHNRGSAFSLQPGHPALLRPGARPPHTLMPVIAQAGDGDVTALGCQGGRAQPWILAQLADRLTDPDDDLATALAADRWVFGGADIDMPGPTIAVEADSVPPGIQALAARRGWEAVGLGRQVDVAGHVQVARRVGERLQAGTDPRADGRATVARREPHLPQGSQQ